MRCVPRQTAGFTLLATTLSVPYERAGSPAAPERIATDPAGGEFVGTVSTTVGQNRPGLKHDSPGGLSRGVTGQRRYE